MITDTRHNFHVTFYAYDPHSIIVTFEEQVQITEMPFSESGLCQHIMQLKNKIACIEVKEGSSFHK
jgi:ATP sulfurylase